MRMLDNKAIKPVMNKADRLKAVGSEVDFPLDPMTTYMTKYAEEIFEPKRITDEYDWLNKYREGDQYYEHYKKGKGNIQWVRPGKDKIYLLFADKTSFTQEQTNALLLYARAFFYGAAGVEIINAGERIPG